MYNTETRSTWEAKFINELEGQKLVTVCCKTRRPPRSTGHQASSHDLFEVLLSFASGQRTVSIVGGLLTSSDGRLKLIRICTWLSAFREFRTRENI